MCYGCLGTSKPLGSRAATLNPKPCRLQGSHEVNVSSQGLGKKLFVFEVGPIGSRVELRLPKFKSDLNKGAFNDERFFDRSLYGLHVHFGAGCLWE